MSASNILLTGRPKSEPGVEQIQITFISPSPANPRKHFDEAAITSLANDIRLNGLIQPIVIVPLKEGNYEIIAGERRFRAYQFLHTSEPDNTEFAQIDCRVYHVSQAEAAEMRFAENHQRANLSAVEIAFGLQEILKHSQMTQEALAKRVNMSQPTVANYLRLLTLPETIHPLFWSDTNTEGTSKAALTFSHGVDLCSVLGIAKGDDEIAETKGQVEVLARSAYEFQWTVQTLRSEVADAIRSIEGKRNTLSLPFDAPDGSPKETSEKSETPPSASAPSKATDTLFVQAVRLVVASKSASTSMLQKRLKIGYTQASALVDEMEKHGIVGPLDGAKPREVLLTKEKVEDIIATLGIKFPGADTEGDEESDESNAGLDDVGSTLREEGGTPFPTTSDHSATNKPAQAPTDKPSIEAPVSNKPSPAAPKPAEVAVVVNNDPSRIMVAIRQEDDDFLFEQNLTIDTAFDKLRTLTAQSAQGSDLVPGVSLTRFASNYIKALVDDWNANNPDKPTTPEELLESILHVRAIGAGLDITTLQENPE
jgi:ParB family transcriptional regulator, chromosome partitioning protein